MPCYKPIVAWKPLCGGALHFSEKKNCREVNIPCGQCIGCRIAKRESWAFRCLAESKMHEFNWFLTLTYAEQPQYNSLDYRDVQLFLKRARKRFGSFRFFVCGEYGDQTSRPHYHMLSFGLDIPDLVKSNSLYSKFDLFESKSISELWGKGSVAVGNVSFESARYCAMYVTKSMSVREWQFAAESQFVDDVTGECAIRERPFARMSLKPGIGAKWIEKYAPEVLTHGAVHVQNRKLAIPGYFQDILCQLSEDDFNAMKLRLESQVNWSNNTRARLEVREECAVAKQRFNMERNPNAL